MGARSHGGRTGVGRIKSRGRLQGEVGRQPARDVRGQQSRGLTCMPKALMATEMGPFSASQAASAETREGPRQGQPGAASLPHPRPGPYSLSSFWLSSTESLM